MMPKLQVSLDQLAEALEELSMAEMETLEMKFNPELVANLKTRWEKAKGELVDGKTLSKRDLLAE